MILYIIKCQPFKQLLLATVLTHFIFIVQVNCQNLVPNGDFEEVINCPVFIDGLHADCANWFKSIIFPDVPLYDSPSPDWFHGCGSGILTPPMVEIGYQYPHAGDGFAGFYSYVDFASEYREIMGVELLEPLVAGIPYEISFYLSRAFSEESNLARIASNNIGIKFSNIETYVTSEMIVDNLAHANIDSIVLDTLNWLNFIFQYTPDTSYQYLHIGNFFADSLTDRTVFNVISGAYYFIDDVRVEQAIMSNSSTISPGHGIILYPNPATDEIHISGLKYTESLTSIRLLDTAGKEVWSEIYNSMNVIQIDVSSFAKGIYILNVIHNAKVYNEKFILSF